MGKKASSAIIGVFVISSIALLVSGVILFGSGDFFKKKERFILFFEETVTGLKVGSPVRFRGVEIGTVKSVILLADAEKLEVNIPIIIEVDPAKFRVENRDREEIRGQFDSLIKLGLRAQLDVESLVTSQLFIQIDFLPNTPVNLSGIESEYTEIPTINSTWQEFVETLKEIPLNQVAGNINDIVSRIKELVDSGKIEEVVDHVNSTFTAARQLSTDADNMVLNLDKEIRAVSAEINKAIPEVVAILEKTAGDLEQVSGQANALLVNLDGEVDPVSESLQTTLASARDTLEQAGSTLATMDRFIEESDTRKKLNRTLDRIADAARSLGKLADSLERQPESLLRGKQSK